MVCKSTEFPLCDIGWYFPIFSITMHVHARIPRFAKTLNHPAETEYKLVNFLRLSISRSLISLVVLRGRHSSVMNA